MYFFFQIKTVQITKVFQNNNKKRKKKKKIGSSTFRLILIQKKFSLKIYCLVTGFRRKAFLALQIVDKTNKNTGR